MKRIIATILALTLLSALAVIGVSATDFVPSTDAWEVKLVSAEANGEDVTSKIVVTHYKDRDTLSAEKKAALQAAYEELLKGVSNVTGDYKVGALFDISYEGEIPEGTTVKVKLELNYGDYVAAGIYKDVAGNKWDNADCVYEDGYAVLTFKHFCPVAILVGSPIVSDVSKDSPQTGDSNSALVALGALVVCTAAAATVVLKKRSF